MTLEELIASLRKQRDEKIKAERAAVAALTELRARVDTSTPPTEDEIRSAAAVRDKARGELQQIFADLREAISAPAKVKP